MLAPDHDPAHMRGAVEAKLFGIGVGSYVLLNGSIEYGFLLSEGARGRVFVRAFNLLDDVHREHPEGDAYGLLVTAGLRAEF